MNAIKMVSWIHLLWGLSMVALGQVPRPFGQLEAFLVIVDAVGYPTWLLGAVFITSGLFALAAMRFAPRLQAHPHIVPLALMPQQLLLTIGVIFSGEQLLATFDSRIWYAACTQIVFAAFHAIGMYRLYQAVIIEANLERKT